MKQMLEKNYTKNRCRGFSCSDDLWNRIKKATKNTISVSTFIRMAVEEKIKKPNFENIK